MLFPPGTRFRPNGGRIVRNHRVVFFVLLMVAFPGAVRAVSLPDSLRVDPGGRFEHRFLTAESGNPFPWNFDSTSPANLSRLMLECGLSAPGYGSLYLKGDAQWEPGADESGRMLFGFGQGDYWWKRSGHGSSLALRLFANERRFFTGAYLVPLLEDDAVDSRGENRGARADLSIGKRLRITSLFASLGEGWDDARKMTYIRSSFLHRLAQVSIAYRHDIPALDLAPRQALLKGELVCFYRAASLVISYQQSRLEENGWFLPRLSFDTGGFVGDNFSTVLPEEGAFFAQLRLTSLKMRDWGEVTVVHDYFAVGEAFVNNLGYRGGERVGYRLGTYFRAREVDMNAWARIGRSVRSARENETRDRFDASVRGGLKNGVDLMMRGGWAKNSDDIDAAARRNHLLGTVTVHSKRLRNGLYVLLRDMDTPRSYRSFAWDSRVVLNADFAFEWRFIIAGEENVRDPVFVRLEFRPSKTLYASASYGRETLGDSPYLLDDDELSLGGVDPSVYSISIRGDF